MTWDDFQGLLDFLYLPPTNFVGRPEIMSIFRTLHHSTFWKTIYHSLLGDVSYNFRPIFKFGWRFQISGDLGRFFWLFIDYENWEVWLISSASKCVIWWHIRYNKTIMQDKGPTHLQILKKVPTKSKNKDTFCYITDI